MCFDLGFMQGSNCLILTWMKYRTSSALLNVDLKLKNYQNLMSVFGDGSSEWTDKRSLSSNTPRLLEKRQHRWKEIINPYPTAFPYGNGMVLHFYQQQESSTTKTVHKVINKGLKAYV